jgi:predicted  nucleic acid-binding Zn-ribbon protein
MEHINMPLWCGGEKMKLKLLEYENTRLKAKLKKIEKKLVKNEKEIAKEISKGSEFKRLEEEFKDAD